MRILIRTVNIFVISILLFSLFSIVNKSYASNYNENSRIIVLDSGLVEILKELGLDQNLLVVPNDISFENEYPESLHYKSSLNIESIMIMQPDLILGGNIIRDSKMTSGAGRVGIDNHHIDRTLPVDEKIRRVAKLFDKEKEGEALISSLSNTRKKVQEVIAKSDIKSPKILHISNTGAGGRGIAVAGPNTPAHNVILNAGAINAAGGDTFHAYGTISSEGILSIYPDVIVVSDKEISELGGVEGRATA